MRALTPSDAITVLNKGLVKLRVQQNIDDICAVTLTNMAKLFGTQECFCCLQRPQEGIQHIATFGAAQRVVVSQPQALSIWVKDFLARPGTTQRNDVPAAAFNLSEARAFPTIIGTTVHLQSGVVYWMGLALAQIGDADLDLLALFAQQVSLVFEQYLTASKQRSIEHQYQVLVEQMPGAIYYRALDKPGTTHFIAPQIESILGITPEQLTSGDYMFQDLVHPEDRERVSAGQRHFKSFDSKKTLTIRYRMVRPDGRIVWIENVAVVLCDDDGAPLSILGIMYDVTEKRELEEQLRQSQKLEAVGQLAGGIAHDFNNLLSVILGCGDLLTDAMDRDDPNVDDVAAIISAGERGAHLVKQLLTFSRKDVVHPQRVRADRVVKDMESMVARLLNAQVEFKLRSTEDLGDVYMDPGQIEQIVMNLVLNARDAMPTGGSIKVSIKNIRLDEFAVATKPEVEIGEYVMLSVSDTGTGMSIETKQRIFEPFYTTKNVGEGTGLGLSTVMGIVRQNEGFISVYTELGHGTTIKVYLPRLPDTAGTPVATPPTKPRIMGGTEHILLVEDDGPLKGLLIKLLKRLGYQVTSADDGEKALIIYREDGPFDLIITDIMMPKINGPALVEELRELNPALAVVYMSGYSGDVLENHNIHIHETSFLPKPFTVPDLSIAVRKALDSPVKSTS